MNKLCADMNETSLSSHMYKRLKRKQNRKKITYLIYFSPQSFFNLFGEEIWVSLFRRR